MRKIIVLLSLIAVFAQAHSAQTTPVPDIAPLAIGQYVVINIPQQRLFFYENGELKKVYPVTVGKAATRTVLGEHKIGPKVYNPTWHIPKSIQRQRGDGVTTIPPGPQNPLGPVFVRMGDPKLGLGIHGTNNPSSVPGVRSHGCVRMKSPDALEFARKIIRGTTVMVSYEMAALNTDDLGQLWLTVFKDPYNKRNLRSETLKQVIQNWSDYHHQPIDFSYVEQIIRTKSGKPVCLSCHGKTPKIQGSLRSLAWNSGSMEIMTPQGSLANPIAPTDDVLPEGTAIEVEANANNATLNSFQGTSVFSQTPNTASTQSYEALDTHILPVEPSDGIPILPIQP